MSLCHIHMLVVLVFVVLCCCCCLSRASPTDVRYVVMIDAGSTGSRVHIHKYHWEADDSDTTALPLIQPSESTKIKPGLSSYNIHPAEARKPMQELIEAAYKHVPSESRPTTPIHLQATAGLRSVTPAQADAVLTIVRDCLHASEFLFDDSWALIISGEEEGINGWIATNYLLGAFNPQTKTTAHGVVEMGGASMQITFSPSKPVDEHLPRLIDVSIAGQSYHLYTHSFLAYGLQEAQKLYQRLLIDEIEEKGNPCYPVGYRYTSTGNFDKCLQYMLSVVDKSSVQCDYDSCSFNGIWQPHISAEPFLAIENFFYTNKFFTHATEDSLNEEGEVTKGNKLISTLKEKGREYCDDPWKQILTDNQAALTAHQESEESLAYYCFAAAYEVAVLEHGFGFTERHNIRPARSINRKSIDWELGATLVTIMRRDRQQQIVTVPAATIIAATDRTETADWYPSFCTSRLCHFSLPFMCCLLFCVLYLLSPYRCVNVSSKSGARGYNYTPMLQSGDRSGNGVVGGLFSKV